MIASQFDLFLFDLDGVVYVGSEALPGAVDSLKRLRQEKKFVRFLTNDPCATRESASARLHKLGIEADVGEMITSSYVTAQYLKTTGIRSVYVLSDEHLIMECHAAGIKTNDIENAEAVVLGWDSKLTLHEVQTGAQLIAKGALFVATSPDRTFPTQSGPALATGALIEMVKVATGVHPVIIGKPHSAMFQFALNPFTTIEKDRVVMIGDNPLTDILGAHRFGISALLISDQNKNPYLSKEDYRNPDVIIPNLKSLFDSNLSVTPWSAPSTPIAEQVKAAVTAVIFDENGNVLLMKRKDNQLWGLPTGHVEVGESVEQAVVREVREETGLEVKIRRLMGVYSDPTTQTLVYPDGRTIQFVTTCFECDIIGGRLEKQTEEASDVAFFHPRKLPENLLHMHLSRIQEAMQNPTSSN